MFNMILKLYLPGAESANVTRSDYPRSSWRPNRVRIHIDAVPGLQPWPTNLADQCMLCDIASPDTVQSKYTEISFGQQHFMF